MEPAAGGGGAAQTVLDAEKKAPATCAYCDVGTRTKLGNLRSCPGAYFVTNAIQSLDLMCRVNSYDLTASVHEGAAGLVFKSVEALQAYRNDEKKICHRHFHPPCGPFKLPATAANDNKYLDTDSKRCALRL